MEDISPPAIKRVSVGSPAPSSMAAARHKIETLFNQLQQRQELSLGYPINQKFDYSALAPFYNLHLNNAGDPWSASSTLLNSRELEQEVLNYFSRLWKAQPRSPLTAESFWGYILGMGSTEGNLYALWSAREYFRAKNTRGELTADPARQPVLFFSRESHYSVKKSADILGIETFQQAGERDYPGECPITSDGQWPSAVPVDRHGAISAQQLAALVAFFAARGRPPLLVLNIGSTFQGAFDDPQLIWRTISPILEQQGFNIQTTGDNRPDCWIHIDGALGAAYLPYLEIASDRQLTVEKGPQFDFSLPCVSSLVMSSHKWYGAPFASGVYMSKEKFRMHPATLPEYIDSPDTTLSGSRNGLAALQLWYVINTVPVALQAEIAARCAALAAWACQQLQAVSVVHPYFQVTRGPQSLVVLFNRPGNAIFQQFQLSGQGEKAHIVVMPHVTRSAIKQLVRALCRADAFNVAVNQAGENK